MASELFEHWRIAQAELLFFHYASFSLSLYLDVWLVGGKCWQFSFVAVVPAEILLGRVS